MDDWKQTAIKEAADILYRLIFDAFERKQDVLDRLINSHRCIALAPEPARSESQEADELFREVMSDLTNEPSRFPLVNQEDPNKPGPGDQF
ncbi:hypothetical protein [Leptolyngbya sp. 7M]|uniref:hypothetical protein n=1 Tax=Leptolyngbya sp. 7M TaxID=2812896 RepID=UPI001B8B1780|nr:hypothetical protein [Leptolyngbya sp. 7M]QYO62587.1 hypothetical protein JVX88_21315 [Leptolyngbya sp. 7M]